MFIVYIDVSQSNKTVDEDESFIMRNNNALNLAIQCFVPKRIRYEFKLKLNIKM